MPEYASIHSHVLQDGLGRLDKNYQASLRRVKAGEKATFPGYEARTRYHSFTDNGYGNEYGNGAKLEKGFLVLTKIGWIAIHWSRPRDAKNHHDL
jgi:putative transposase